MIMNVDGRVRIMNNMAPPNTAPVPPGNRLEVTCSPGDPYYATPPPNGASGLRLTLMTTSSVPVPNPGQGYLSVDKSGDVIYVDPPSGGGGVGGLGGPCPAPSASGLLTDWDIPLNNKNYIFSGNNGGNTLLNNVGIGTNCTPIAKLHVDQSSGSINGSMGIFVENTDFNNCSTSPVIGIKSLVSNTTPLNFLKIAGWFESVPSQNCFGSLINHAIVVPQNGGMVHLGYNPVNLNNFGTYLLDVNGHMGIEGDIIPLTSGTYSLGKAGNEWFEVWATNTTIQTSDERKKENIKALDYGLKEIMQMNPVRFNWKNNAEYGENLGFIAQQLKGIVKEVVREGSDENKTLGVKYADLIPVLVNGIKEQQTQIEEQKKVNDDQQKQIDELKALVQSMASGTSDIKQNNSQAVELSDKNAIVLNQNVPNPFAESTVINYNIPSDFAKAQIIFSTSDGKIIKSVDVTSKGRGTLNVFANDLSSGMYTYTLVVDGKTIDTKKMVKD
jgi:hypothetical protein